MWSIVHTTTSPSTPQISVALAPRQGQDRRQLVNTRSHRLPKPGWSWHLDAIPRASRRASAPTSAAKNQKGKHRLTAQWSGGFDGIEAHKPMHPMPSMPQTLPATSPWLLCLDARFKEEIRYQEEHQIELGMTWENSSIPGHGTRHVVFEGPERDGPCDFDLSLRQGVPLTAEKDKSHTHSQNKRIEQRYFSMLKKAQPTPLFPKSCSSQDCHRLHSFNFTGSSPANSTSTKPQTGGQ